MKSIKMVPINDYVSLKMEVDRLNDIVDDLTSRLAKVNQGSSGALEKGIIVSSKGLSQFIKVSDIVLIKADSNYSTIYLSNGESMFTSKTLKYWEEKCNASFLYRVHKSYIVNGRKINTFEPKTRKLVLDGDIIAYYTEQGRQLLMGLRQ
jgi:two-component system LytT family response regulator